MKLLNFAEYKWSSAFSWRPLLAADELPLDEEFGSSALCVVGDTQIAVFRSSENNIFASQNLCGHRVAFVLSEGTVEIDKATNETYVVCPLHRRKFFLNGERKGHTKSKMSTPHSIATFAAKEEDGRIWVYLPCTEELDAILGTHRWQPARPALQSSAPKLSGGPLRAMASQPGRPKSCSDAEPEVSDCATTCKLSDTCNLSHPHPADTALSANRTMHASDPSNGNLMHRRAMSDTESDADESLGARARKEDYEVESEPECPIAAAEGLSW